MPKFIDGVLYISNSTLKNVSCSTRALLYGHHRLTSPDDKHFLVSGNLIHQALAVYFRGSSAADALAFFDEVYEPWSRENIDPGDRRYGRLAFNNIRLCLYAWLEEHSRPSLPYEPMVEYVEVPFAAPLNEEGTIALYGIIDLVARDKDTGAFVVVDHKSTGDLYKMTMRESFASQMPGYTYAINQLFGVTSTRAYLNGIETKQLPSDPVRKCKTHSVPYAECGYMHARSQLISLDMSLESLEEWRKTALTLAKQYWHLVTTYPKVQHLAKVRMQGRFNGLCEWCDYLSWCKADRPIEHLLTMHDPMEEPASASAEDIINRASQFKADLAGNKPDVTPAPGRMLTTGDLTD